MLLMLAEAFELSQVSVIQANTDGLFVQYKKILQPVVDQICKN
jgi:hypothetical protein